MKVLRGTSGITVLFRPMETNLVDVQYYVRAGAADESPAEWGYCHALEHMVFAGTKKRNWLEINRAWEKCGTYYNARTSHDLTAYHETSLKKYWQESYEILTDMLYNCQFPQDRWEEVEKPAIISEIEAELDDEETVLSDALYSQGIGPRYHSIQGGIDIIKKATVADITCFYEEYYQGNNVYLIVTGNLTEKQLMKVVNRYDRLQTRNPIRKKKFRFHFNAKPIVIKDRDVKQGYIQTLLPLAMPRTYRTKIGLELGVECLSQYLFEELRAKRGLVYDIEAGLEWSIPGHVFLECNTATDLNKLTITQQFLQNALFRFSEEGLSTERITNMKMSEEYNTLEDQEDINSSGEWLWDAYEEKQTSVDPYKNHLKILERLSVESIRSTTRLNTVGTHKLGKLVPL